nr:glycosyltransferase family 4 protein [Roseateles oligotrophus]
MAGVIKPKVFWWHPKLMDYRRPLFDQACAAWDVHFLLLADPGAELRQQAEVTVCDGPKDVAMRPWRLTWAEIKTMWKGVREADAVISSFLWNSYTLCLLLFCRVQGKPLTVWEELSRFPVSRLGRVQAAYYRFAQKYVNSFFTLGQLQRRSLLSMGADDAKIFVANEYPGQVYSKVPPRPMDLPGQSSEQRILFLGRLIPVKGVDVLLRAFAQLQQAGQSELDLLLVGEGTERAALQALAQELGVAERTHFLGAIHDPAQKSYLLRECALMAVPSVTHQGRTEGGPLVILEAMSAGLPVVSSNAVGSSEVFVRLLDERLVVPQGDVGALADAMWLVLGQQLEFRRISEMRFSEIPGHDWQFSMLNESLGYIGFGSEKFN